MWEKASARWPPEVDAAAYDERRYALRRGEGWYRLTEARPIPPDDSHLIYKVCSATEGRTRRSRSVPAEQ
jgi:hypothetical protein